MVSDMASDAPVFEGTQQNLTGVDVAVAIVYARSNAMWI